jgi:phosphate-selective porin OprO/OprP
MGGERMALRRGLGAAAAAAAIGIFEPAASLAAEGPAPADIEALRAQVRELTALVRSEQGEVQELAAQVKALQGQPVRSADGKAGGPPPTVTALARTTVRPAEPAIAQIASAAPRVTESPAHRFALQSANGEYSIGFTGNVQLDTGGYVRFKPASSAVGPQALSSGVNARRARIGVTGRAAGDWSYAFVYDAGNSSDQTAKGIETAQIAYNGLAGAVFEIGYSNTYFTLDQATSSADTLFFERASPSNVATNINTGDARANAGVRVYGDRYWAGAYLTGPASGDSHTLTRERFGAFQRVAFQVLKGPDYSVHFGLGLDELLQASNAGNGTPATLALNDPPELRIDPTNLLNTGTLGTVANPVDKAYVVDLETAATYRNLFWQGEYYRYQIDRRGLRDAWFSGGYGQVAWTLTGEAHRYNPQSATYARISPARPFSLRDGGWGAWELAARASYVDLDSHFQPGTLLSADPAAVDGGRQRGYTLGLNWYPNDLVRLLLDYNHVDYDKANGVAVKGVALGDPVGARLDAVSLRVQVSY